ncbi:MAG: hypothetical protein ACTSRP_13245 [Candidatus Helarchaeota archaeon]
MRQLHTLSPLVERFHVGFLCQPIYLNNEEIRDILWTNDGSLQEMHDASHIFKSQKNFINPSILLVDYFKRPLISEDFI